MSDYDKTFCFEAQNMYAFKSNYFLRDIWVNSNDDNYSSLE